MSVNTHVKRFSRSKIEEEPQILVNEIEVPQEVLQEVPKKRGRKKGGVKFPLQNLSTNDDSFLDDLKVKTTPPPKIEEEIPDLPPIPEQEVPDFLLPKRSKKTKKTQPLFAPPPSPVEESSIEIESIFTEKPTEFLGKDRRVLLTKICQFKKLFPQELKDLKIKKNASVKELEDFLEECNVIIELGSVECFCRDAILHSFKLIEGATAETEFDVTGLSLELGNNPQFTSLCKRLYIKYGSWTQCPPEYQLMMVISVTAYGCIQKNRKRSELTSYLNQPI